MSSHDISISTPYALAVHPAATVGAIVEAVNQLVTNESRRFALDAPTSIVLASEAADVEIFSDDGDNHITIAQGRLSFSVDGYGPGHGVAPDWLHDMVDSLAPLLMSGGVVELVDHDISASNKDEAVSPFFIGVNRAQQRAAQLAYGLDLAQEHVTAAIGASKWAEIVSIARQSLVESAE